MTKLLKNNKGFTLVEVIVVAVIVLILAAVAIPLYNGYIRDSRQASLENAGGAIASALGAARQTGKNVNQSGVVSGPSFITMGSGDSEDRVLVPANMQANIGTTTVTMSYITANVNYSGTAGVQFSQ